MRLVRVSLLNSIAVLFRMAALLGINKILAVYVGPVGYALVGQFQNTLTIAAAISGSGLSTGVIKYTAEFRNNALQRSVLWKTAWTIALVLSFVSGIIIAIFSREFADLLLKDPSYDGVFIWFAAGLVFLTINTLLLAILNGLGEIEWYVILNIAGSLISVLVTAVLVFGFGIRGALVALSVYQAIAGLLTLYICSRRPWFSWESFLVLRVDYRVALNLIKFALMALTTALSVPISQIVIRNYLVENLDSTSAGVWEALCRLSGSYLLFITATFSVYYLPRLSELREAREIWRELRLGIAIVLPVTAGLALTVFLFRESLIIFLFSKEFSGVGDLLPFQLLGDLFKMASWVFSFVMLGKAMFKLYVITEIAFSITFVLLSVGLVDKFGLVGTAIAHMVNYILYGVVVSICVWQYLKNHRPIDSLKNE